MRNQIKSSTVRQSLKNTTKGRLLNMQDPAHRNASPSSAEKRDATIPDSDEKYDFANLTVIREDGK